jgi:hypothetical protein
LSPGFLTVELIVSCVPLAYWNAGQGHLLYELILRQVVETKSSTKWNVSILSPGFLSVWGTSRLSPDLSVTVTGFVCHRVCLSPGLSPGFVTGFDLSPGLTGFGRLSPGLVCHRVWSPGLVTGFGADELPVVGGVARVERTDARSSRAVVKTALTCGFLLPK